MVPSNEDKRKIKRKPLIPPSPAGVKSIPESVVIPSDELETSPVKNVLASKNSFQQNDDDDEIRKTNIRVCIRIRPLIVASSPKHVDDESSNDSSSPTQTRQKKASQLQTPSKVKRQSGGRSGIPSTPKRNLTTPSRKFKQINRLNTTEISFNDLSIHSTDGCTTPTISHSNQNSAWEIRGNSTIIQSSWTKPDFTRKSSYIFDRVYDQPSSTVSIYQESVQNIVLAAMEGYHGSVFAYGQTSTGKTYTMHGTNTAPGVIPLAVQDCFRYIQEKNGENREYLLRVSYMEIYNEQVNDLLSPSGNRNSIRIFESRDEGVVVRGVKEEIVTSPEQIYGLIEKGDKVRKVGSTNLNKNSSRSHSIFRLMIESRVRRRGRDVEISSMCSDSTATDIGGPVRVSSLCLVDLAGSESAKATGSSGQRQKEGQFINKSLMTLGHVIWKLSEMSLSEEVMDATTQHIPYRDSKLTRLLQPSLRGNAQICIICNISPSFRNLEETYNTLKFANRAKKIKQNASITEVVNDKTLLQNYREEIDDLKKQLKEAKEAQKSLKERVPAASAANIGSPLPVKEHTEVNEEDTNVLVEAIKNLERLILKNKSKKKEKPLGGEKSDRLVSDGIVKELNELYDNEDEENLASSPSLTTSEEKKSSSPNNNVNFISNQTPSPYNRIEMESESSLVDELHRIQGLLGSVLKKKKTSQLTDAQTPMTMTQSPDNGDGIMNVYQTPKRDEEVEILKAQLQQQEVASELRLGDSSFLESQLAQKDSLLKDVSRILDAVEKRQTDLENENAKLKQDFMKTTQLLELREKELEKLKMQMRADEDMFSNLL